MEPGREDFKEMRSRADAIDAEFVDVTEPEELSLATREGRHQLIAEAQDRITLSGKSAYLDTNLENFKALVNSLGVRADSGEQLSDEDAERVQYALENITTIIPLVLENPESEESIDEATEKSEDTETINLNHIVYAYIDRNLDVPPSTVAEVHQLLERYDRTTETSKKDELAEQIEAIVDRFRDDETYDGLDRQSKKLAPEDLTEGDGEVKIEQQRRKSTVREGFDPEALQDVEDATIVSEQPPQDSDNKEAGIPQPEATTESSRNPETKSRWSKMKSWFSFGRERAKKTSSSQFAPRFVAGEVMSDNEKLRSEPVDIYEAQHQREMAGAQPARESSAQTSPKQKPDYWQDEPHLTPEQVLERDMFAFGEQADEPLQPTEPELSPEELQAQIEQEQAEQIAEGVLLVEKIKKPVFSFLETTKSPYEFFADEPFDQLVEAADPKQERTTFLNIFNEMEVDYDAFQEWMARVEDVREVLKIVTADRTWKEVWDEYILKSHEADNTQFEVLVE